MTLLRKALVALCIPVLALTAACSDDGQDPAIQSDDGGAGDTGGIGDGGSDAGDTSDTDTSDGTNTSAP